MGLIVKNTTLPSLFELLAPHSCRGCGRIGGPLCNRCKKYLINQHQNFCPNCKNQNPTGLCPYCKKLPPTFVVNERAGLIDDLIHEYKYSSNRALAKPLAEILNAILPPIDRQLFIIPLPTINPHIRERGFDHTLLLAKQLAKFHPDWQVQKLLTRTNNSIQVGSDRHTRKIQASTAYTINPKIKIVPSTTYLLLDDVWTTGSSMLAAVKKLQQAGVSEILLSILAVSRLDD